MPTRIVVDGLWEAYRRRSKLGWRRRGTPHWALRDVSLTVPAGSCLGVIGGNGSGKTTLLQVVAGVLRPTRGRVEAHGRLATLVDLSAGFHRDLTGRENLLIGGVLLGLRRHEVRERLDEIVEFSGLDADTVDAPLAGYSAGMGLRLGFSLVVCSRPDVLLVDEVLAVGDDAFQRRCFQRIDELRDGGCAVMFVSHDMSLIREHTDEVAVLERGELAYVGAPAEAVAYHLDRRGLADTEVAADRNLFDPSARADAARRRRGVR
ncbi:MAG TPA: ABC transporter ATP-binding protein [Acidimicrobiales bacterium]|nr:ABC transporter ATP-binding protein [Acidimicrobiales bacterium]